jgi:hypothetical protein
VTDFNLDEEIKLSELEKNRAATRSAQARTLMLGMHLQMKLVFIISLAQWMPVTLSPRLMF